MTPTEIAELQEELSSLLAEFDTWYHNVDKCLERIIFILNLPEIEINQTPETPYVFKGLLDAFMRHDLVEGLRIVIERNLLQSAMLADHNLELTWKAAGNRNPEFFSLIFNHSNRFSIYGDGEFAQRVINGAFVNACEKGRFDTMRLLVDFANINSQTIAGYSILSCVIRSRALTNLQQCDVLEFLIENGVDFTSDTNNRGYSLFKTNIQKPFEMLLEVGNPCAIELLIDSGYYDLFKENPSVLEIAEAKLQEAIDSGNEAKKRDYEEIIKLFSTYGMLRSAVSP